MGNREERNRQQRENAAYKKSVHRCVRCGKQDAYTLNGRSLCAECAEYDRERVRNVDYEKRKEQYYQRKENHLCVHCGKPFPIDHTKANCHKCLQKAKQRAEQRRRENGAAPWQYRLDSGLCFFCMKEECLPGKKTCKECSDLLKARLPENASRENHPWRKPYQI